MILVPLFIVYFRHRHHRHAAAADHHLHGHGPAAHDVPHGDVLPRRCRARSSRRRRSTGSGPLRSFFVIGLPMMKNAILTVALVQFFSVWNDLLIALTFTTRPELATIQVGLLSLQRRVRLDAVRAAVRRRQHQHRRAAGRVHVPQQEDHGRHGRRVGQGLTGRRSATRRDGCRRARAIAFLHTGAVVIPPVGRARARAPARRHGDQLPRRQDRRRPRRPRAAPAPCPSASPTSCRAAAERRSRAILMLTCSSISELAAPAAARGRHPGAADRRGDGRRGRGHRATGSRCSRRSRRP